MRLGTCYRYLTIHELKLPLDGNNILDVGCYDGFLLSKLNAKKKYGIDIHPLEKYPLINYIEDNFLEFNFDDITFDRIFAFDVIEHVKEDKEFLDKIVKLLSPGGCAIISTPSKVIKIFPSFLQNWVNSRWDHIYRSGYDINEIEEMLFEWKKRESISYNVILWNAPSFRFTYLGLSLIWRLSPTISIKLLKRLVKFDMKMRENSNGYFYIIINKSK